MSGFGTQDNDIIKQVENVANDNNAATVSALAAVNADAVAAADATILYSYVSTITMDNIFTHVTSKWIDTFTDKNGIKYFAKILYYRVKYIGTEFCKKTCKDICMSFGEDKRYITNYVIDKFYKLCSIFSVFNYLLNFVNSLIKLTTNVFFFICSFLSELFKNFGVEYDVYVNFMNILYAYDHPIETQPLYRQLNKDYIYAHDLKSQMIEKLTLVYSHIFPHDSGIDFKDIVSKYGINILLDLKYLKIAESKDLVDGQTVYLKFDRSVWLVADDIRVYDSDRGDSVHYVPNTFYSAENLSDKQFYQRPGGGENDKYHLQNGKNIKILKNADNQSNFRYIYTVYVETTRIYQLCRALIELYKNKDIDQELGRFIFNGGSKTKRQRKQRQRKQKQKKQKSKRKKN
jgi:hypothetical protein